MTTTHRDNWGWRARIGMFIVGSEAVPEAEWWAMIPPDVSVHAARVNAPTPWAPWDEGHQNVTLSEDLLRGARQFAAMRLEAIVVGHSSSSIMGGPGWDDAVIARLAEMFPEDVAISTNGRDCVAALQASNVHRPFLVFPPWFGDPALEAGRHYFAEHGFDVAGDKRYDPGRGWNNIPPSELYAHGAGFEQNVEALYSQIRSGCPDGADGVLIAGTGFRCVGIIDALESDLGRPVITANQASLWHCLQLAGVGFQVAGYGRLLNQ